MFKSALIYHLSDLKLIFKLQPFHRIQPSGQLFYDLTNAALLLGLKGRLTAKKIGLL
jgi:hypothetical protein